MDFRQLKYFVAVAEELSFSRAARRLHVSQPPLSVQIKATEVELGTRLFIRDRRHVALTKAGEVFLVEARAALAGLDRAGAMARLAGKGKAGRLRLGFVPSVPLLPLFMQVLREFKRRCPLARVDARLMSTGRQLEALADGELDIGIVRPPSWFRPPSGMRVRTFWRDRLHVYLPDDHPLLSRNASISPGDLGREPFITFAPAIGCGLAGHTNMLCGQAGFEPTVAQEVDVASSVLGLVAIGMGIAILPECHARSGVIGVASRPLSAADSASDLLLAYTEGNFSPLTFEWLNVAGSVTLPAATLRHSG